MFSFDSRQHHFDDGDAPSLQMGERDRTYCQRQLSDHVAPYKGDFDVMESDSQFADMGLSPAQAMG